MADKQRISYVPIAQMDDEMRAEMERCAREGTPRPESFIGLTFGQQSWLRMLNIGHHQVLPGSAASLAPGFETPEAMAATKASDGYWAKGAARP